MGYLLDSCPIVHGCCACAGLRAGAGAAGALGLCWGALYLAASAPRARAAAQAHGVPARVAAAMRLVHGALGVLLCAIHVLLIFATIYRSGCLCELYVWFMIVFWVLAVISGCVISISALVVGNVLFACIFLVVVLFTVAVSCYFTIVVANYRTTIP